MRILQLMPTLSYGDAVGNDAVALYHCLSKKGYSTGIYAEHIDSRMDRRMVKHYSELPDLQPEDILLYHFSTGSDAMSKLLHRVEGRKVMIYHNITPGEYFEEYNRDLTNLVDAGRRELVSLQKVFECCLAVSGYNKHDLREEGYTCPIAILPILIPFEDYRKKPDTRVMETYGDGLTNILFTGRIAPNKKQEDVIASFAYYHSHFNPKSRLFLVGNDSGMESYSLRLKNYARELGLEEQILFTGHISFSEILAYYRIADLFLCMSDHEGFCVPLVEAMVFSVPVLAYGAAAIPETLGDAGILTDTRDPAVVAGMMDRILKDSSLKGMLEQQMKARLEDFSYERTTERFEKYLTCILEGGDPEEIPGAEARDSAPGKEIREIAADWRRELASTPGREEILPFSRIPIEQGKAPGSTGVKKWVKKPLKLVYRGISSFSPGLADSIRETVYGVWHRLSGNTPKMQASPLERDVPGLLVDVTQTTKVDVGTGIQRVVNNIFRQMYEQTEHVTAVRDNLGQLITSYRYVERIEHTGEEQPEQTVGFLEGDRFLLLDSSWEYARDFSHILNVATKSGAKTYAVIYDMFPVQYPELFDSRAFVDIFRSWHDMVLRKTDGILCISKTTADVVAAYFEEKKFKRENPLELHYFHMGADVPSSSQSARREIKEFLQGGKTFLMVGTLEPRKGHMVALDAFQKLCGGGRGDIRLLILGHDGWKNDDLRQKLESGELRQNVLWIKDATDEELRWAYANADALIAASKDEGFGLPLIEAAYFGLPILCSDIPIFREVTQGNADYFRAMDADSLAERISAWLREEKHPDSRRIHIYTWQEAAKEILDIVHGKAEPYRVLP